jgi:CDP-diglyceride synthetase
VGFIVFAIVVIAADILLGVSLIATFVTILALFCLVELRSLSNGRVGPAAYRAVGVQALVALLAVATVWVADLVHDNLPLVVAAVAVPAMVQNMAAYYIGRFWLTRQDSSKSLLARLLGWHHFKHSPRKTFGVTIASSAIALAVGVACFFASPLLLSIAAVSAIFAAVGDLTESRLKRLTKVTDSGEKLRKGRSLFAALERTISSHGGFLDRFDSLFFCAALALVPVLMFIPQGG